MLRVIIFNIVLIVTLFAQTATVPLYRVFEHEVTNDKDYMNNFTDVTLNVQYQAPSGRLYNFLGFYNGNGKGDSEGNVWKMRFMPDEMGNWTYVYTWSDRTAGGSGSFAETF